jgi:hypothetical protein
MKKLTIILLLIVPMVLKAQVPGYQGKRLIVYYNLSLGPNFIQSVYNSGLTYPFQIHTAHSLDAEYILSRKFSLEGEFSFLDNKFNVSETDDYSNYNTFPLDLVTTGFGINCVFYGGENNAFAPVGNFFKIKLAIKNYTATGNVYSNDSAGNSISSKKIVSGTLYGFGLELGHHLVIKDKVILSASLNADFNLPIGDVLANDGLSYYVYNHLLDTYIIYLRFGIGGLLH